MSEAAPPSGIDAYIDGLFEETERAQYAPYDTGTSAQKQHTMALDPKELVELGAVDTEFFCRTFFARAFRQESPKFAPRVWEALEGPDRLVDLQMFRGSSKTTRARAFVMKRICYALANTIMLVSKSERDALRSGAWLKQQVEYNKPLAQLFGLRKGSKWTDDEFEILHGVDHRSIWVICSGITGSLRGINRDDFRPDLILLDDINNEESSGTKEQRKKISDLVFGALLESLTPRSEAPHAKVVNLATPLHQDDITSQAQKPGSGWHAVKVACWTPETAEMPPHLQESSWPARWSSEELRAERDTAGRNNRLSVWLREKALQIIAPENSAFRFEWLQRYSVLPEDMTIIMAIDPVPPPSQHAIDKDLHKNDFEAMAVVGVHGAKKFLLDGSAMRGHDPSWTCAEFMRLAIKWRPQQIVVEAVAYQRVLRWILQQEMKRRGIYFALTEMIDQRSKFNRITDGLHGDTSNHAFFVPENAEELDEFWTMFLDQFRLYPRTTNDDCLEAVAVANLHATTYADMSGSDVTMLEKERERFPRLQYQRACP